jgi:fumarate hydratase class II
MGMREERDTMGIVKVPSDKLWGAQTQRSIENFRIGRERMPLQIIYALALIKKAAAIVNADLGSISKEIKDLIVKAADEVLSGKLDEHFPLLVWQTGSGTQTNMNVNEVISNVANLQMGNSAGSMQPVHPNDHVNRSQSSNDVVPTAISVAVVTEIKKNLIPKLRYFHEELLKKSEKYKNIVKCGRTHLMDATPLTLGQEFSAFESQILNAIHEIEDAIPHMSELALGGTAVGTGLNTHIEFSQKVAEKISELSNIPFTTAKNKFEAISTIQSQVRLSGALKTLAVAFMKIANDIRLLGSGPRCGIGELNLPSNEPGSSIMPGKVNPTQCEMMTQVALQVLGNDVTIAAAGTHGHLQLNVFRPLVAYNLIQSIRLMADAALNFTEKCLLHLTPNLERIKEHLENSLMLVTALNTHIGYEKAAHIAHVAHERGITLKESALALGFVTEEQYNEIVDPHKMLGPKP